MGPPSATKATVSQTYESQTTAETEKATDANWSIPRDPTRRMPVGESRRSTMRKTAIVGTPIVRIHVSPGRPHRVEPKRAQREERGDEGEEPHAEEHHLTDGEGTDSVLRRNIAALGGESVRLSVLLREGLVVVQLLVGHDHPFLRAARLAGARAVRYYLRAMRRP